MKNRILLYGPTASGKSGLAYKLAQTLGGVIINADAMQCYHNLKILTARPDYDSCSSVPHYLYGTKDARDISSVADWAKEVALLLQKLGKRPAIICGGSGLYFEALTEGLSSLPAVSVQTRSILEEQLKTEGSAKLYSELQKIDESWAGKINPNDSQRIVRGLAMFAETGKNLSSWIAASAKKPLLEQQQYLAVHLSPARESLWQWSKFRLEHMIKNGCFLEVANLERLGLNKALPLMRAIGVQEFLSYLCGTSTIDMALEKSWTATRQYIKRQNSWGRTRFKADLMLQTADETKILDAIM